jgi:hypothetical protein
MRLGSAAVIAAAVGMGLVLGSSAPEAQSAAQILVQEDFENTNLGSKGWYDTTGTPTSTAERFSGTRSNECRFAPGGTNCANGTLGRHALPDTESVYIAYYIKHSTNWVGSNRSYHPHMFMFLTNLNGQYSGLAYTYLTAYIENVGGIPRFSIQDGQNIDETRIGQDLTNVTEQRSVAGCNGDSDGHGNGSCYVSGSVHWNGKTWSPGQVFFDNTSSSPRYKGNWHLVEAFFQMNSIANGRAARDGIVRYWYDGAMIMEHTNIVLRTGARATQRFNQLAVVPWIGDGSPADQTYWVDNLLIATARPATPPPPPGGGTPITPPAAPTNVRIVR